MVVGTTALITGGIMGAASLGQTVSGIIGKNKYQKQLDNLEVPELENAFEDISISTVGSDLMREESARTNASLVDAVRSGGSRSVYSAIPKIASLNTAANQEARKYLDDQVVNRDYAIAQDDVRIRGMEENRYQQELQGLGQAIQSNRQDIWSGVRGIASTGAYMGRNLENNTETS
ncbi:hypothetical protein [Thalassobellus suaedae]|uniref:Internal virion protein B n=1 Tax=Thalassobellus suaedae TaxID=3074124 RepID=A0ABY9XVT1_9FLAO|nr:hypothetical protein RHP51_04825 [Flavobacteriaceae bacterium HL-DH14]